MASSFMAKKIYCFGPWMPHPWPCWWHCLGHFLIHSWKVEQSSLDAGLRLNPRGQQLDHHLGCKGFQILSNLHWTTNRRWSTPVSSKWFFEIYCWYNWQTPRFTKTLFPKDLWVNPWTWIFHKTAFSSFQFNYLYFNKSSKCIYFLQT